MKAVPVKARKREATGKGVARKLRAAGAIPGILYGAHTEPTPLELNQQEISVIMRKSTSEHILVDLTVADNGGEPTMALIREIQHEPITGDILHVDFLHISATQMIHITVPVSVVGIADGVKNFGGILQLISRELEIESLPANIPETITVDVTELGIGDAIHVRDLDADQCTFVTPGDRTVVSVVPPTVIKEVVSAEEEVLAEGEDAEGEPEVIGEKAEGSEDDKAKDKDKGKDKG
jgi:large subunit ribosomal protein L25